MTEAESKDLMERYFPEMKTLVNAIDTLPASDRERLRLPINELLQTLVRRIRATRLLQEAFEEVRLDIKYLQFDLKATRSERDEFQRRLAVQDSP